jgi:tetratricopeptide (TPR) repeat protein
MSSKKPYEAATQIAVMFKQALSWHQQGRLQEAASIYQRILSLDPKNFDALHGLGILYGQAGYLEEAVRLIGEACTVQPDNFLVHYNRGKTFQELKRLEDALWSFDTALALKSDYVEALINKGNALNDLRRHEEALLSLDKALALRPDSAESHYNRAIALECLGRHEEALNAYDKAIALNPGYAKAYLNRGNVLKSLEHHDEALASYSAAIALKSDFAEAHNNLGTSLEALKRYEEALSAYDRAIVLNAKSVEFHINRGHVLQSLQRCDEALVSYDEAIGLEPDVAEFYNDKGNVLTDLRRFEEAKASYDKAIALNPSYATAYYNLSLLLLRLGDYEQGWPVYEWRWKARITGAYFSEPLWLGERSIAGKTILLHAEQGYGDSIQFVRYAQMVEALGANVILWVPGSLVSLFKTLNGSFRLFTKRDELLPFDMQCPLMSLPLALGTTVARIPAQIPYLFADPNLQRQWQARLGPRRGPRVGLAWSGSPQHKNDSKRSIPLRELQPFLDLDVEYHSLQKELREEDRAAIAEFTQIRSHEEELGDFADTAALIAEMDLIITVDTAVAHLAGALGKAVWIMLPYVADFRWLIERSDSPWYPTARLFRQSGSGNWRSVMDKVRSELHKMNFSE